MLPWGFISLKRHHDHGNSWKGKLSVGAGLQFRDLVHYCHGEEHGSVPADMALVELLRVLHLHPKSVAERPCVTLDVA